MRIHRRNIIRPAISQTNDSRFWIYHLWLPLLVFSVVALVFGYTSLDVTLTNYLYYTPQSGFFAKNSWWSLVLIHRAGTRLMWVIATIVFFLWLSSYIKPKMREYRNVTIYIMACMLTSPALVGIGKQLSNTDCPGSLEIFGGTQPYVELFADRPNNLPRGHCFPASHSAGAFTLVCLYFVLCERRRRLALLGLATGLLLGGIYAFGQEARGAHFMSHDLCSAFICWFVALFFYIEPFHSRLWWAAADQPLVISSRA